MQEHARKEADSCDAIQNLANSHWIITQQNKPVIQLVTEWIEHPKNDCSTLSEFLKGHMPDMVQQQYAARQKDFVIKRGLLYLKTMPNHSNEDIMAFVMPTHKC